MADSEGGMDTWSIMKADVANGVRRRPGESPAKYRLRAIVMIWVTPRLRAVPMFRVAHLLDERGFTVLARWVQGRIQRLAGADIHPAATIGPGLWLAHSTGIVIGHEVVIGRHCELHQGVTLGSKGASSPGQPTLGDHVVVGAGAVLVGPIAIGDGVKIGANTLVTTDVPAGMTVVGTRSPVVERRGTRAV